MQQSMGAPDVVDLRKPLNGHVLGEEAGIATSQGAQHDLAKLMRGPIWILEEACNGPFR